ncbi:MAG TPA: isochorismatase family cysteine hydrolase [Virgibacillus sp.]|nr:isochorismatase family cysteine hydrolase [Virgibacillus sp.]
MMDRVENNAATGLILVDLQNDFCHPEGTAAKRGHKVDDIYETLERIADLLYFVRNKGLPVFHVVSQHSLWTQSPTGKERFGRKNQMPEQTYCAPHTWGSEVYPLFTPFPSEKVIVKHRYSVFLYTDLELVLMRKSLPI